MAENKTSDPSCSHAWMHVGGLGTAWGFRADGAKVLRETLLPNENKNSRQRPDTAAARASTVKIRSIVLRMCNAAKRDD
jgi:hypothetical protein